MTGNSYELVIRNRQEIIKHYYYRLLRNYVHIYSNGNVMKQDDAVPASFRSLN